MSMKKFVSLMFALAFVFVMACGKGHEAASKEPEGEDDQAPQTATATASTTGGAPAAGAPAAAAPAVADAATLSGTVKFAGAAPKPAVIQMSADPYCQSQHPNGQGAVDWSIIEGDFPTLVRQCAAESWPTPHAILFDAYSPSRNPEMWAAPLFARIFELLDSAQPCALPTYSRSTMLRVSLLLAGFFVGAGHPTGEKEETTIAANQLGLIEEPLGKPWLKRARLSTSAEPLWEPVYRQAPLTAETLARLEGHPQFQ